ncbi:MAG: UDP-glucose 4-epimerase GalE [Candidatus Izemoplasma sp.]|nr:UDP-glucose 4-epimerase GalE [Candidatus Izemoplasma sp.]
MNILVTGGLGYIGSHTILELDSTKNQVIIVDNLANSKIDVLKIIQQISSQKYDFYKYDVTDYYLIESLFMKYKFDTIMHFAGFKAVGESVQKPLTYYKNNLLGTIILSELAIKYGVEHFIFSSSATVYGDQQSPLFETLDPKKTTNPYGETKAMSERILIDTAIANPGLNVTLLRYFNPVGAHNSGLIGENSNGTPNNLVPYITKVAKGELKELSIFGNDYDTEDGTGVRDYIHVVDLAKAHVAAMEHMKSGVNIYNLGTGKGISVLEMVHAFEKINALKVPFKVVGRRPGDLAVVYADVSKAKKELQWEAKLTLEDMVRDAWNFEKNSL